MNIKELMADAIASGLKRKSVTSCSRWAEHYRVMGNPFPGPWSFDHHPWLLEMHDAVAPMLVGQKAAQMGYTEWAMNTAFFCMDVKGMDVLYVLPTTHDASDFSAGRFDPALETSPHLRSFFGDVNNVGLKRAGNNILYVRGSHSRSQLKSIPTPVLIFDEVDEMPRTSIALAKERQSGQVFTLTLALSTPTIDDFGINGEFKLSTQEHFFFKCPSCSRLIELLFPDSLVITADSLVDPRIKDSHFVCHLCKNVLPLDILSTGAVYKPWLKHKQRGGTAHFVAEHTDRDTRGFHVSQLYSMAKVGHPAALAQAKLKADLDPTYAQEFWNSKLGLTFEAKGARVQEEDLNACVAPYVKGPSSNGNAIITMGVDVGAVLHVVIKEFTFDERNFLPGLAVNDIATPRLLYEGETNGKVRGNESDFDDVYRLFLNYRCTAGVVDAEPERREALRFAQRLWGRILLCDYLYSQQGREVTINEDEAIIKANRTAWMDVSLGRYRNRSTKIPTDTSIMFRKHIREPVRVFKEDKFGNKYGVYEAVNADHFAHADTYSELALPLGVSFARNQDVRSLY